MILLVLILTLELIERSAPSGAAAADRKVARDLRAAVDHLEDEARTLTAELTRLQAAALRSASFSEQKVRLLTKKYVEDSTQIAHEIDLLEPQSRLAVAARRRAEEEAISEQSRGSGFSNINIAALEAQTAQLELANRMELERQVEAKGTVQSISAPPTLVFHTLESESLRPRLVDASEDGLTVLATDSTPARTFPRPNLAFERWLANLDKRSEYVVVLLRPSGIPMYYEALETVRTAGLAVGAELIGESTAVTTRGGK